ncbi:MAG: thiamine-phosphate kinase [Candidatus Omnitrophica bacterium]|nr:thiamine-phosphate kinase [Candidatus Omnitrophota bacterium]
MPKKISEIGEWGLIDRIRKDLKTTRFVQKGAGDDAAVITIPGSSKRLLYTTDMLVEDVHFTKDHSPKAIGHKAIACSMSDVAAMGGLPKYAVVSIGISGDVEMPFVNQLYAGMNEIAVKFGTCIVGGDTVKSRKLIINVTLLGEAKESEIVYRSGARKDDVIFVTGLLGRSYQSGHHLKFIPRVMESQYIVGKFKPTSMIDISDGLGSDLSHIMKESGVGAVVYEDKIPRNRKATVHQALTDGEDYELLFTLPADRAKRVKNQMRAKFFFGEIGKIIDKKEGFVLLDKNGQPRTLKVEGFNHF